MTDILELDEVESLAAIEENEEDEVKLRPDEDFHNFVQRVTESSAFNVFIMFSILCNALTMMLESNDSTAYANFFLITDDVFLAIYTWEFILKVYAEPKNYWKSGYNLFDVFVLIMSYTQIIIETQDGSSDIGALKILRALRTLRALKTISFIRGLQVLVTALLDTIRKSVLNIVFLLLLIMFLFATFGYYIFGQPGGDVENWGDLGAAMLTLFSFVTVEGWTKFQTILDDYGMGLSGKLFTVVFIVIGHFIFTNVFIGVIIMNISEATEAYKMEQIAEREATLQLKKDFMLKRQHADVKKMLEKQKLGHFSNFNEMVQEFQSHLRHDDYVMMTDLCNNIVWMEMFTTSLDHMDNSMYRCQQLHFEISHILASVLEHRLRAKAAAEANSV